LIPSDRAAAARRPSSAALSLGRTSSPLPPTELRLRHRPEAARRTKPDSSSELELKLEPAILTHFLFDFLSLTRFQVLNRICVLELKNPNFSILGFCKIDLIDMKLVI
ncbi:hypothetical protein LINPERHAP1_LOCUS22237, partial [Linum perenne]